MKYLYLLAIPILLVSAVSCRKNPQKLSKGAYEFITDDPNAKPFISDKKGVFEKHVMVASAHPEASKVGAAVMKKGGNAVDAAVATFFALAVVHPSAGNLGGGGYMVFRDKTGQSFALDFREKAPAAAFRDMYLDSLGNVVPNMAWLGHSASGVPGSVDGMVIAHQKFGKMSWKEVLQPAIDLAEKGVSLTENEAKGLNRVRSDIKKFNPGEPYFLKMETDTVWKTGENFVQTDLGKTLRRIQEKGRAGFYEGETAALLIQEMSIAKAPIVQKDLDEYHSAWRTPISDTYRGHKIISMSPTSSGGIALVQLMKMVEPFPLKRWGWHSDSTTQVIIEAERRVYADRAKWLGDPDFFKVPAKELLEPEYLKRRWSDFSWNQASDSKAISGGAVAGYESNETTHFSVVDEEGNAVSITTTINNGYGSRVVVNGAGFLMNDEMEDFAVKPGVLNIYGLVGAEANSVQPGKRMLSSMTPTIVEKDGKLFMVVGTPGGSTIITSVFQTISNVIDHGMGMQEAVNALKFHHQWLPDRTTYERGGFSDKVLNNLKNKGYVIEPQAGTLGRMDCILVLPNGTLEGGSDPRADDTSVGW